MKQCGQMLVLVVCDLGKGYEVALIEGNPLLVAA